MGHRYDAMVAAAYRKKGEDWRNLIIAWDVVRAVAPWAACAVVLGTLGWLAHHAWAAVTVDATAPVVPAFGAVPAWLWLASAAGVAALLWLFRPGRHLTARSRRTRVVQVFTVVILFAGVVGLALGSVTGTG